MVEARSSFYTIDEISIPGSSELDAMLQDLLGNAGLPDVTPHIDQPWASTASGAEGSLKSANTRPAVKRKRKQFSSCDACRLRKVKCIKEDAAAAYCNSCASKGIACTNAFTDELEKGKGKRIEQARQTFGGMGSMSSALVSRRAPCPASSTHSALANLNQSYISSNALQSFLDVYEQECLWSLPTTQMAQLRTACQEADFNASSLDDMDRLLALSITAIAAGVQTAQRRQAALENQYDLQLYAAQGAGISRQAREQLLELSDRIGLTRKPTHRGLQALRMLMVITSDDDTANLKRSHSYRAFEQTYVDHLRTLTDLGEITSAESATFFWSTILGDHFGCSVTGDAPSFTQEDIETFAPYLTSDTAEMIKLINEAEYESLDIGAALIFGCYCKLNRTYWSRVTSAKARQRPFIDLDAMNELLPEIDRLTSILDIYEQRITSIYADKWPAHLFQWTRIARFLFTYSITIALQDLEKAVLKEMSSGTTPVNRLCALQQSIDVLQTRFVHEILQSQRYFGTPVAAILGIVDGMMSYVSVIRMRRILKIPSSEEGGTIHPSWTLRKKAEIAKFYLSVCEYLGQSVMSVSDALPKPREDVNALQVRASGAPPVRTLPGPPPVILKDLALSESILPFTPPPPPSLEAATQITVTTSELDFTPYMRNLGDAPHWNLQGSQGTDLSSARIEQLADFSTWSGNAPLSTAAFSALFQDGSQF